MSKKNREKNETKREKGRGSRDSGQKGEIFRCLLRNGRNKTAQRDKETENVINSYSNMEDRMTRNNKCSVTILK